MRLFHHGDTEDKEILLRSQGISVKLRVSVVKLSDPPYLRDYMRGGISIELLAARGQTGRLRPTETVFPHGVPEESRRGEAPGRIMGFMREGIG